MSGVISGKSGRIKELQIRGIGPDTLILPDSGGLLLEKESLKLIANEISAHTGRKLVGADVQALIAFIKQLPPEQFYQKPLGAAIERISKLFVNRHQTNARIERRAAMERGSIEELDHADGDDTVSGYLKREALQTTDDENPYKWTAFPYRNGQSAIDHDRVVNGTRSSPDNVKAPPLSNEQVLLKAAEEVVKTLGPIRDFINTENIDQIFKRAQSSIIGIQTFQGITLPRREIMFDSRNKDLSNQDNNTIRWLLNPSGQIGQIGNIHIQDTLQQIIRVKISPFWMPVSDPLNDYYSTYRMAIKEFWQRTDVTEYLDANESIPTYFGYQFQFKITRRGKDRVYLEPENAEYSFSTPVAKLDTLTVLFYSPFKSVQLNSDRGTYSVAYSVSPTVFTLTNGTNTNLNSGDLVYVLNFTSANAAINNQINTLQGLTVTRISNTVFSVPIDTSALGGGPQTGVIVIYGSKRIFFQMNFTSLER